MPTSDIFTARLRLVTLTPEALDIQEKQPEALGHLLKARIPPSWPLEHWEPHVYDFLRRQFESRPDTIGWHRYLVLRGESPALIGALGSHPKSEHEAEIGYGIAEPWRDQGFATEAARALMLFLFAQGILRVRAQTFPSLTRSLRVMEKCGMTFEGDGEEEGAVCYAANEASLRRAMTPS